MIRRGKPDLSRAGPMRDRPFIERAKRAKTSRDVIATPTTRRFIQRVSPPGSGGGLGDPGGNGVVVRTALNTTINRTIVAGSSKVTIANGTGVAGNPSVDVVPANFGTTAIANGGTGQTTQQTAINALTNVAAATNEHVLTKDTATGDAVFKAATGGGAPTTADYLVRTADAGLSAERVVTDTTTVTWDWATAGQAKANVPSGVVTPAAHAASHAEAGADRITSIALANTGLTVRDTDDSHELILKPGSNLTANHTLTLTTGDADRTLTVNADTTLGGGTHSGTNTGDQTLFNQTFEDEGTPVTQRSNVNFTGAGVSVADTGGKTVVTIPGGGGSTPTGTGFRHVTGGVEDAAAKLVDTADINDDQVTYAKIQNSPSASVLLGRGSAAGAGNYEPIEVGTGLKFTGTTIDTVDAVTPLSYSPGSFTVATEEYVVMSRHLKLATTQRVTLQGTATLRVG